MNLKAILPPVQQRKSAEKTSRDKQRGLYHLLCFNHVCQFLFLNLCSCDINHDDLIGCNWWPVDWDCCYRTKTDGLVIVYSQIISNLEQLKCKFSTRSL